MERSGLNSDPVFSDQDEHSDNVSVRSSSKLLPPPSWNESSVYSKELPAGATLEHYKILKVLGSGGFGITYLVRDTMLKRKVVLKENFPSSYAYRDPFTGRVIPNNEHDAESFQWTLSNFLNEARVLAQLDSPGIVRVLSVFECNGTAYFSMDYVQGLPMDYLGEQQLLAGNCYSEAKLKGLLGTSSRFWITFIKKASATGISNREISCLHRKGLPSSLISARRAVSRATTPRPFWRHVVFLLRSRRWAEKIWGPGATFIPWVLHFIPC